MICSNTSLVQLVDYAYVTCVYSVRYLVFWCCHREHKTRFLRAALVSESKQTRPETGRVRGEADSALCSRHTGLREYVVQLQYVRNSLPSVPISQGQADPAVSGSV